MASHTEEFFDRYAQSMDAQDAEGLAAFHLLPSVFVRDDSKRIYTDMQELSQANAALVTALAKEGVTRHVPSVKQAMQLSDSIIFANVRWQFKGADGAPIISCYCSYTLQQVDDSDMKIIVAVLDDEDKVVTKLLKGSND